MRLAFLRAALAEHVAQRRLYRSTLAELNVLSDRDLSDLGLSRANVGGLAREVAVPA